MLKCDTDQSVPKEESSTPHPGVSTETTGGPSLSAEPRAEQRPEKETPVGREVRSDSRQAGLPGDAQREFGRELVTGDPLGFRPTVCCDNCLGSPVPAARRCLTCRVAMCTQHLKLHDRNEVFQGHSLADVEPLACSTPDPREEKGVGLGSTTTPWMAQLAAKLKMAEDLLQREQEREASVRAANAHLREKAQKLLQHMTELVSVYETQVTELVDTELRSQEESLQSSVCRVAGLQRQLQEARLRAAAALVEGGETSVPEQLQGIQAQVARMVEEPLEGAPQVCPDTARLCAALEAKNAGLRAALGATQRGLRCVLNPSEVTLDPNTVHPSLLLSEDLTTVVHSATKQPYPQHPERFASFLQVLSSQGFSGGQHRWQVEAQECQWVLGVCYRSLARVGLASALESSSGSWCLMWCDNLLRAYSQGRDTPLLRTTALRKLDMHLNYEAGSLSFYSCNEGKVHLHTFKTTFTEPVYLALRMMSCKLKSRITLKS